MSKFITDQAWIPELRGEHGVFLIGADDHSLVVKLCRPDRGSNLLMADYIAGLQVKGLQAKQGWVKCVFQPTDFQCWCTAKVGEACKPAREGDQELAMAQWHQDRMRHARDAHAALEARFASKDEAARALKDNTP